MKNKHVIPLENIPCPLCGLKKERLILKTYDINSGIPGEYNVSKCLNCGMCYLNPRPTALGLSEVYPEIYARSYIEKIPGWVIQRIRFLKKISSTGRLLEIGCSAGHFLNIARKMGYDVTGIEIDKRTAQYAKEHYGLEVKIAPLEDVNLPADYFDLVVLFDVFEHLREPMVGLEKIFNALIPGGHVIIKVPNFSCLESMLFRGFWYHLDLPRHLLHFSPATLTKMLTNAGFSHIKILHQSTSYGLLFSIGRWILSMFGKKSGHAMAVQTGNMDCVTRALSYKKAIYQMISLLWLLPGSLLSILGQGSAITVVAQKRE
jgi:2-polyprenyl-3-methyl-5-hydroxy-6-metoxy-1,4-benzoquinol methylase